MFVLYQYKIFKKESLFLNMIWCLRVVKRPDFTWSITSSDDSHSFKMILLLPNTMVLAIKIPGRLLLGLVDS